MQPDLSNIRLDDQQLYMLQLFETSMPEEEYLQMRRLAVQLLANRLNQTVDEWEQKNGSTENYYEQLSKQHFRSSGENAK
jgi:hypothetical protein